MKFWCLPINLNFNRMKLNELVFRILIITAPPKNEIEGLPGWSIYFSKLHRKRHNQQYTYLTVFNSGIPTNQHWTLLDPYEFPSFVLYSSVPFLCAVKFLLTLLAVCNPLYGPGSVVLPKSNYYIFNWIIYILLCICFSITGDTWW